MAFNESPLGPFPAALDALAAHLATQAGRYPEADARLIETLSAVHDVPGEMIVVGNGGDAVIGYVCAAYLRPGDEVITGWPSFPTYLIDATKQGAEVVTVALRGDGAFDLPAMAERLGPRTRLIWVCTPNNPTGGVVDPDDLRTFLDAVPEDVLVVIDEAYHEFCAGRPGVPAVDAVADHIQTRPNVAALRTFSKMFGLAGMRVGWLAAPAPVAVAVAKARHYYDVTGLSAIAAIASAPDAAEIAEVSGEEAGPDPEALRFAPRPLDLARAEVGADDTVAEPRKADRLRADAAGAVEDRTGIGQQVAEQAVKRRCLPLDSAFPLPAVGQVIVGSEIVVKAKNGRLIHVSHHPTLPPLYPGLQIRTITQIWPIHDRSAHPWQDTHRRMP